MKQPFISSCMASMPQLTFSVSTGDVIINGENSLAALAVVGVIALVVLLILVVTFATVVYLARTKRG